MNTKELASTAGKHIITETIADHFRLIMLLLRNHQLYFALFMLISGFQLNFASQEYLHNYVNQAKALPVLSDLILDNLPYYDISIMYDIFSIVALVILCIYVIHRKAYLQVPYLLILCGIYHIVRAAFIILTPFGNPPMFDGTDGPFGGFAKFELGVYPSGHAGIAFLYFLVAVDRNYRALLLLCVGIVIMALFLSRGHYSIDVLSGIFFAYAIKSFGDRHILRHMLCESSAD